MPRGGTRPHAGRKKGKTAPTLEKEMARERRRQRVFAVLDPLIDAQVSQALGIKYLVTRDRKTGKFIRVTEAMAKTRTGDTNEEIIEVWEKDPSVQAFTDLMNRTLDKPAEHVEMTGEGQPLVIHWLE